MIVFTPDGRRKNINDKKCIEHVQQVMETTPGFDMVYDRGAYVLDVDVTDGDQKPENNSGSAFPSYVQNFWREP